MISPSFEDYPVGRVIETKATTLSEADIVSFARLYDPQTIHTDPVAAQAGPFGGLIASGFQTVALGFRLFLDTGAMNGCSLGGPAMDNVRWLKPVRPNCQLRSRVTVLEATQSRSKSDRGAIKWGFEIFADDVLVCTGDITSLLKRREAI
jgi:acyl dehydratase